MTQEFAKGASEAVDLHEGGGGSPHLRVLTAAEIQVRLIGLHDDAAKWQELVDRYGSFGALMEEIDQNEWLLGGDRG